MIDENTILLDLVEKYPQTEDFFRNINNDSCILCYNLFDSLGEIANELNLDIGNFLEAIESQF